MPLKFDISSQNFDNFFAIHVAGIGEKEREMLPRELNFKIFKKGHRPDAKGLTKLSFLSKIFILVKALRKRMVILVEDENGLGQEEYFEYMKLAGAKKQELTLFAGEKLVTDAIFVLAKKEVMDTYCYMNELSASKPYNYLSKGKNLQLNKTTRDLKERMYITQFLSYYESNRKRLTINTGVNFSEWMVLIYLYGKDYTPSVTIHKDWYRYSFNSSATKLKQAVKSLQNRGYIEKIGSTFKLQIRITTIGKKKCDELVAKYVVNC